MAFFGKVKEKTEDVEEEEDEEDDSYLIYLIDLECYNCNEEFEMSIPKGTTVEEFTLGKICENCGCRISQLK